jgi:pimeloyl-ACP methyl ester carboxylesterase
VFQDGARRIFYTQAGKGPAVVLLHGLSGSGRWWRKNMHALSRWFTVYAVDFFGFGGSRGQRFVLENTADSIAAWMDAMDTGRFHLIGHSMGGMVAADLAAEHPGRIDRLVLVDAVALPFGHTMARSALHLVQAVRWMRPDFLPVLVTDALRAGPLTLLRAARDVHHADLTDHLQKIAARTLIVWGEHDTLLPPERGAMLHQALPGSEFVVIPRAGHNPMWDEPEAFNRLVLRFLLEQDRR